MRDFSARNALTIMLSLNSTNSAYDPEFNRFVTLKIAQKEFKDIKDPDFFSS